MAILFNMCAAAVLLTGVSLQAAEPNLPKLGMQSWTFNSFSLAESIDKTAALGIHYMEVYPGQKLGGGIPGKFGLEMDESARAKILALAKNKDVHLISMGVITPPAQDWPKVFAFAQEMGMHNITSEPPQDTLPLVDKLSRQYGITVAFHDHPKPSRYWDPAIALAALQPYGPELGICADTGHWVRSGFDPVKCLKEVQGHILECHFKDLNQQNRKGLDVPWGTGTSNAAGQLAELRRQGFTGVVLMEYENHHPGYEQDLPRCVAFFNLAMQASLPDLEAGKVLPP